MEYEDDDIQDVLTDTGDSIDNLVFSDDKFLAWSDRYVYFMLDYGHKSRWHYLPTSPVKRGKYIVI